MKKASSHVVDVKQHPDWYKILSLFHIDTIDLAQDSASQIFYLFHQYLDQEDFVGADIANAFLQSGYEQSLRKFESDLKKIPCDIDQYLRIAQEFKSKWDKARMDPAFLSLQESFMAQYQRPFFENSVSFATIKDSLSFPMNPFTLLKKDHKKASDLFRQLESTQDRKKRKRLFRELKNELLIHSEIEEKFFYPVLEQKEEDVELEEHAIDEHDHVKERLETIESLEEDEAEWMKQMKKLREDVEHHVEEEESEIFQEIRSILNEQQLVDLGNTMKEEKKKRMEGRS